MSTKVAESVRVPMEADRLWRKVGSFGSVGDWHPMLAEVKSDGDEVGATRIAHARDGSTQVERLKHFDGKGHVYRYAMEATYLPVRDYIGEFRVEDNGDRTSTVVWSAQFEAPVGGEEEVVNVLKGFFRTGIGGLKKRCENAG